MSVEEIKSGDKVVLKVLEDQCCVKIKAAGHGGTERYVYDGAFGEEMSQSALYERTAKPIVDNVLRGMNCCMFAYGQTGTGEVFPGSFVGIVVLLSLFSMLDCNACMLDGCGAQARHSRWWAT